MKAKEYLKEAWVPFAFIGAVITGAIAAVVMFGYALCMWVKERWQASRSSHLR